MRFLLALILLSFTMVLSAQNKYLLSSDRDSIRIEKLRYRSYYKHFPNNIKLEFAVLIPTVDSLAKNNIIDKYIDSSLAISENEKVRLKKDFDELQSLLVAIDQNSTILISCLDDLGFTRKNLRSQSRTEEKYPVELMQPKFKAFSRVNTTVAHEVHAFFIKFYSGLKNTHMRQVLQVVFNAYLQKKVDVQKLDEQRLKNNIIVAENEELRSRRDQLFANINALSKEQITVNEELAKIKKELSEEKENRNKLNAESETLKRKIHAYERKLDSLTGSQFELLSVNNLLKLNQNNLLQGLNDKTAQLVAKENEIYKKKNALFTLKEKFIPLEHQFKKLKQDVEKEKERFIKAKLFNFVLIFLFVCAILGLLQEIKNKQVFKRLTADLRAKEIELQALVKDLENKEKLLEACLVELNHRVRNNLRRLICLFDIQQEGTRNKQVKQALANTKNRIQIMSMLYNHLYFNDKKEYRYINLIDYIKNLILFESGIFSEEGKNVKIEYKINKKTVDLTGKDLGKELLEINPKDASDIGIVVNELIVNSFKYGLDKLDPKLEVEVEKLDGGLLIRVKDNGSGFPVEATASKSQSFGMTVINILAEYKGWFKYYNAGGACSEFYYKLS